MVNLIGDSCVASYITRDILNQTYINPFCWNIIDLKSFEYLIKNYENINFNKIEVIEKDDKCRIIIDNNISVLYEHYIKDIECIEPLKKNNNVYINDLKTYVIEKYKHRLQMNNIKPIYIVGSSWHIPTDPIIDKYINLINANENKNLLILIVNSKDEYNCLIKYETQNVKIFYTDLIKNNLKLAHDIFDKYNSLIL